MGKVKTPTIMENDSRASEHHKAKFWRQHVVHLSIDKLAELTGYSSRAIYLMELGCTAQGKKVRPWVWQRYKMACAAVHFNRTGKSFDWGIS